MLKALTIQQARDVIALAHAYLGRGHDSAFDDRGAHLAYADDLENPKKRMLYQAIKKISPAQRRELTALMWVGRGIYRPAEWLAACRYARANQKDSDLLYMIENGPLGEQLERGLEKLELNGPGTIAREQPNARCAA
jgi:hypothetical protein